MDDKNQRQYSNFFINPSFQGKIVFIIIMGGFALSLFFALLYYYHIKGSYESIFMFTNLSQDFMDNRFSDLANFGLTLTIISLFLSLTVATWVVIITHRAAGPVYQIKQVCEKIIAGDMGARLSFRKKDEFHDMADAFNLMMSDLQKKSE